MVMSKVCVKCFFFLIHFAENNVEGVHVKLKVLSNNNNLETCKSEIVGEVKEIRIPIQKYSFMSTDITMLDNESSNNESMMMDITDSEMNDRFDGESEFEGTICELPRSSNNK